jgi:type IX secretion system PorP/SprF family membrane protein
MKKWISILILNLLIGLYGFGQQSEPLSDSFIELLQNKDVFFNRKLINPTNLTDSNNYLINIGAHLEWIGSEDNPKNGFFVSGERSLPSVNGSVGLNIEYRNLGYFQHRSFNASYKYILEFDNETVLNLGVNIGIWQYRYHYSGFNTQIPFPIALDETVWFNSSLLDIGASYKYKNQTLRLSYNNIINSNMKLGDSDNFLRLNGIIANYQSIFNINKKISIIPEVFGCFDSNDNYGIIACKLDYYNVISSGLLYNTKNSLGIYFSGLIKNRFKIGYFYEIENISEPQYSRSPNAFIFGVIL